jgi:hypothetical protein
MTKRLEIMLIIASPLIMIAPYITIPIVDIPLLGAWADSGWTAFFLGIAVWLVGCISLLVRRVNKYGKNSIPRVVYVLGILLLLHAVLLLPVDMYSFIDGWLFMLFLAYTVVFWPFELLTVVIAVWTTVALIREPEAT